MLRAEGDGSLPAPLLEATTYYAIRVDDFSFQVSASAAGPAIDLTTEGDRTIVIAPLPITKAIQWASALLMDQLPAHVVPESGPYPTIIVATTAELAIAKLLTYTGQGAAGLKQATDDALARARRWAQGVPLRGPNAPAAASLAFTKPVPSAGGWGCGFQ